jgi:hypothetical protein
MLPPLSVYGATTLKLAARVLTPCDSSACARTELPKPRSRLGPGRRDGILAAERILLPPA